MGRKQKFKVSEKNKSLLEHLLSSRRELILLKDGRFLAPHLIGFHEAVA
jgi:hypothetical protein